MTTVSPPNAEQYACASCGAALEYTPGTTTLTCPYCGAKQDLPSASGQLLPPAKHDYAEYCGVDHPAVSSVPALTVYCRGCGSEMQTSALSLRCEHCNAPIVAADDLDGALKAVDAVVPFVVDQQRALAEFRSWTKSRWFAPNALKKVGSTQSIHGAYVPHWGFDDSTTSDYLGERGEYYYTTETYTTTENGKSVTRTRQVRHTAWYPASGRVARSFVDVVAPGVSQPEDETLTKLGPWTVEQAAAFEPEFLAGFDTPRYDKEPAEGFVDAREQMAAVIREDVARDIGGDEQRVASISTADSNVLFRLLLMPLWFATYLFAGATYHVYINANTGEVIGERPYSKVKIALAVLAAIVAIVAAIVIYTQMRN
jgi:DNA-directed RNA polymerase subunit RPC12/RpoP